MEEKKDSTGHVIERTPIYETVEATVTEVEVTKTADASLSVDVLEEINRAMGEQAAGFLDSLPENGLELASPHGKRLLDTEQLRELLQQVRGLPLGEIETRVDGPQFDFALAAWGINVSPEAVLAENGSHVSLGDRLAPVEDRAFCGFDAGAQIAIPLSAQEQIDGGFPHLQQLPEDAPFEVIQAQARSDGLLNEDVEIAGQFHEDIGLAQVYRR